MTIKIKTTPKNIEAANCILNFATDAFRNNPQALIKYGLTKNHLKQADKFRMQLVDGFKKEIMK